MEDENDELDEFDTPARKSKKTPPGAEPPTEPNELDEDEQPKFKKKINAEGEKPIDFADPKQIPLKKKLMAMWQKYQPSMQYCPLHPSMLFSRIWNSVVMFCYLIAVILLPLPFGFASLRGLTSAISIFVFIVSFLDLLVKLQTGYAIFEVVVMEPKQLISIYLRNGEFALDLLCGFPWALIADSIAPNGSHLEEWVRLLSLLNAAQFLRSLLSQKRSWISEKLTEIVRQYDINLSAVNSIKILFAIFFYWYYSFM
jgi:hypothetical protein